MITRNNASGPQSLFTADGGLGQQKWYSVRLHSSYLSTPSTVQLLVNGVAPNDQPIFMVVSSYTPSVRVSDHLLLTTGDVVSLDIDNPVDFVFGAHTDADEV